ncbi:Mitochondrial inner membrane organizing system component [Microsporum audouinii]
MADSVESTQPVPRASKPVSETLLNEKWDRAISSLLIRSSVGLGFGVVFSILLFKRRAWPAWIGLGFGAGRAWEEADDGLLLSDEAISRGLRTSASQDPKSCLLGEWCMAKVMEVRGS